MSIASRRMGRYEAEGSVAPKGSSTAPAPARVGASAASTSDRSDACCTTEQLRERWLSSPQGEPSGVCTGHKKPHESGSSLRTVVVRSWVKKAPRWMERKCEMYRQKLSLSATMVKPAVC